MNRNELEVYNERLARQRGLLIDALSGTGEHVQLEGLLRQVDQALERIQRGTYGLCETCHDSIEAERLAADPLERFCLDHLTPAEQRFLERDLGMASTIQSTLLPPQGFIAAGWGSSFLFLPAGPVSGDYCDIIPTADGSVYFFIGDVSGKGVSASLLMAQLHAIVRTLTGGMPSVSEIVEDANRLFSAATGRRNFATLMAGRAFPDGKVELCSAAHCPAFLVRKNRSEMVRAAGLPLGLFAQLNYSSHTFETHPGDILFLCTDGLLEARNAMNDQFGEERLESSLCSLHGSSANSVIERIRGDLTSFLGGSKPIDDLTLLVLQRQ